MASNSDDKVQILGAYYSEVLAETPACLQFCPTSPELFVVGLYTLEDEGTQQRSGRLMLFQLGDGKFTELYSVKRENAVLAMEFHPFFPKRFATAMSEGKIGFFELDADPARGTALIENHGTIQAFPPVNMVLALSWHKNCKYVLGASLSTGHVTILQFDKDFEEARVIHQIPHPHQNEAWSLAWTPSPYSPDKYINQGLYSGGDDSRLRGIIFTMKPDKHVTAATQAAIVGGATGLPGHHAGITAILPLPLGLQAGEDIILTGSYDDYIRVYTLYDHRANQPNQRPKILTELFLGDGVWRLTFLRDYSLRPSPAAAAVGVEGDKAVDGNQEVPVPDNTQSLPAAEPQIHTFRVLASCMRAGAHILEVRGSISGEWTITRLAAFTGHGSMCYSAEAQPVALEESLAARLDDRSAICISASFYDRLLCVWRFREGA